MRSGGKPKTLSMASQTGPCPGQRGAWCSSCPARQIVHHWVGNGLPTGLKVAYIEGDTIYVYTTAGFGPGKYKKRNWCILFPGVCAHCSNMKQKHKRCAFGVPHGGAMPSWCCVFAAYSTVCIYPGNGIHQFFSYLSLPETSGGIYGDIISDKIIGTKRI